ncbi:MAG: phosphoribosylglycinamide formyltransferase [Clostridiales bacterium]|jgi:phosphoribosylglycinamide formyltransferase-1|nr:phosphoribosylglycinamide formyltransferase [Clostridiales bacterium]
MLKLGVLVSGGGTNLQALIDAAESKTLAAEITAVISSNPSAYALERAKQHDIVSYCVKRRDYITQDSYDKVLFDILNQRHVDLVVLAGFLPLLGPAFISAFERRVINVHPSLIPAFCGKGYYGIKVHEAALARGVKVTGATVHFVDEGTDSGPIILQKAVDVKDDDTPESLRKRVMEEAEWVLLSSAVGMFAEGLLK